MIKDVCIYTQNRLRRIVPHCCTVPEVQQADAVSAVKGWKW